jgi:hypothetical protein
MSFSVFNRLDPLAPAASKMTMTILRRHEARVVALAWLLRLVCLPTRGIIVEGSASYTLSIRPGTDECFYLRTPIGQPSVIRCVGHCLHSRRSRRRRLAPLVRRFLSPTIH